MKKVLIGVLMVAMSVSLLAGCSKTTGTTKTGLGHSVVVTKATDATAAAAGVYQVDVVMVAVTIDANNKIVSVTIDKVQPKVNFGVDGKASTAVKTEVKTAVELGTAYGLAKVSVIKKEWSEQMKALETWMVGKTIAEVKAMKTYKKDDSHPTVPDEADLKTSVTVNVGDYIAAVDEAIKNAK